MQLLGTAIIKNVRIWSPCEFIYSEHKFQAPSTVRATVPPRIKLCLLFFPFICPSFLFYFSRTDPGARPHTPGPHTGAKIKTLWLGLSQLLPYFLRCFNSSAMSLITSRLCFVDFFVPLSVLEWNFFPD